MDDCDDGSSDLDPRAEAARQQQGRPMMRRPKGSCVALSQRRAAQEADPNAGHCIVTSNELAVELCPVLPRATPDRVLDNLEWAWGLKYLHLFVDSRKSLCFLDASLHYLFDQRHWFLVPEVDIVTKMSKRVEKSSAGQLPPIQEIYESTTTFEYRLVPMPTMSTWNITRRNTRGTQHLPQATAAGTSKDDAGPSNTSEHMDISSPRGEHAPANLPEPTPTVHQYPFASLAPLQSHIHPHFVIFNAGQKLSDFSVTVASLSDPTSKVLGISESDALLLLVRILDIYKKWRMPAPTAFLVPNGPHSLFQSPDPNEEDEQHEDESHKDPSSKRRCFTRANDDHDVYRETKERGYELKITNAHYFDMSCAESVDSDVGTCENGENSPGAACDPNVIAWRDESLKSVADDGMWHSSLSNEDQLGSYAQEHACAPRHDLWKSSYASSTQKHRRHNRPKTWLFSSNDWAVFHEGRSLTS